MDESVMESMDGSFLDGSLIDVSIEEVNDSYSCDICEKSYKSKSALKRHVKVHSDKYQCKSCTLFFDTEGELCAHKESKHQPHLCVTCGKRFATKSNLDRHAVVHGDVRDASKVLKCPHENCDKQFLLKASYEAHVNIHSGLKPYDCLQCWNKYSNKYKRNQHEKICSGRVSVTCTICQMVFTRQDQLKKHQSAQHTDKRFYCTCGKSYSYLFALKRHEKSCTLSMN